MWHMDFQKWPYPLEVIITHNDIVIIFMIHNNRKTSETIMINCLILKTFEPFHSIFSRSLLMHVSLHVSIYILKSIKCALPSCVDNLFDCFLKGQAHVHVVCQHILYVCTPLLWPQGFVLAKAECPNPVYSLSLPYGWWCMRWLHLHSTRAHS